MYWFACGMRRSSAAFGPLRLAPIYVSRKFFATSGVMPASIHRAGSCCETRNGCSPVTPLVTSGFDCSGADT